MMPSLYETLAEARTLKRLNPGGIQNGEGIAHDDGMKKNNSKETILGQSNRPSITGSRIHEYH